MKRASVSLTPDLETKVLDYLKRQRPSPSFSKLVNVALADYLERQLWKERGHLQAEGELDLPSCDAEVESDVSLKHDTYL